MKEPVEIPTRAAEISAPDLEHVPEALPVLRPKLPPADRLLPYLRRIDEQRLYSNWGPLVRELEARLAERVELPPWSFKCAGSGTLALTGAILAVAGRALPERPRAVVPAFTFVATALAAEQCGYEPLIADIDPETLMLDPARLMELPEIDQVGIVIPVAPFGSPVPQRPWREFSRRTGIPVVIDDAASFECLMENPRRTLGEIPVAVSFHATKAFGCGEGGCVICQDRKLARKIWQSLNFGFFESRNCEVPSLNGKMSEYHAAVGLAELEGWDQKLSAFREVAARYRRHFSRAGLEERFRATPEISATYAIFVCKDPQESERLQRALAEANIGFRLWYGLGLEEHTHWADPSRPPLPVTERLAACHLGLPWAVDLEEKTVERTVAVIRAALSSPPSSVM